MTLSNNRLERPGSTLAAQPARYVAMILEKCASVAGLGL